MTSINNILLSYCENCIIISFVCVKHQLSIKDTMSLALCNVKICIDI